MKQRSISALSLLAFVAAAQAQYTPYPNTHTFMGVTSVNNVPIIVGTRTGATFRLVGTDLNNAVDVVGGNQQGNGYAGQPAISDDGNKVNVGIDAVMPDSSLHNVAAIFDFSTMTLTAVGGFGFYSASGTIKESSNGWNLSGDGSTVVGQGYYNTTGFTGTRVNPLVGTTAGGPVNLFPNTSGNGRTTASNYDGTVVGGYQSTSAVGFYYTKSGSTWSAGSNLVTTFNNATVNLGSPAAISQDGRLFAGNGSSSGQRPYLWDRVTGQSFVVPNPYSTFHRATATDMSAYGDIMCGFWVDFSNSSNLSLNIGYFWTRELGHVKINDWCDQEGFARGTDNIIRPFSLSPDGEWMVGWSLGTVLQPFLLRLGTFYRGNGTFSDYVGDITTQSFTYVLKDSNGTTVDSWSGSPDERNHFAHLSRANVDPAGMTITIKGSHWLAKTLSVDSVTKNALDFAPINGDVDGDNEVGPNDFSQLSSAFGTQTGDTNFNPNADLDGDGEVGPSDFSILSTNFGQLGD